MQLLKYDPAVTVKKSVIEKFSWQHFEKRWFHEFIEENSSAWELMRFKFPWFSLCVNSIFLHTSKVLQFASSIYVSRLIFCHIWLTVYESAMVTNLKNVKITYKCKQTVTKFQLIWRLTKSLEKILTLAVLLPNDRRRTYFYHSLRNHSTTSLQFFWSKTLWNYRGNMQNSFF